MRQGCILSPILFLIFINGLIEEIKKLNIGVLYGKVKIAILLFADDIALLAESREDLEILMRVTSEYSKKWRFDFNYDKSAVVIFENTRNNAPIALGECINECLCGHHWKLGDKLIIETDMYKYLGIELEKN